MLRDLIHEVFLGIMGFLFIWLPVSVGYWGDWLIRVSGIVFLLLLLTTYTVGFRFADKFRDVLWSEKNADSKLPMSFAPANTLHYLFVFK